MTDYIMDRSGATSSALVGRVAVVTGGGQGIGLETARVLAHCGAHVGILEISEHGHEAAERITAEGGIACSVHVDVADPDALRAAIATVAQALGPVDVLINNAALFTVKPLVEHTVADWDRVLATTDPGFNKYLEQFQAEICRRQRFDVAHRHPHRRGVRLAEAAAFLAGMMTLALALISPLVPLAARWFSAHMVQHELLMALADQAAIAIDHARLYEGLEARVAELERRLKRS